MFSCFLRLVFTLSPDTRTHTHTHTHTQEFACNGTVVDHSEYGEVIQLQGDQRNLICDFLIKTGLAKKEQLKVHGF